MEVSSTAVDVPRIGAVPHGAPIPLAKRAFDLAFASIGLAFLAPLFLVVAVLIWADDGRPVFFRQVRVGRGGRQFLIWKFRTMTRDAELRGPQLTTTVDPRVTVVGRRLRAWKLDELPQLLNVVAGEMSLVGPRPEVPRYVAHYTAEQLRILAFLPGITDPATLLQWGEEALGSAEDPESLYLAEVLPEKLRLSVAYAERATVRSDLGLIARTLKRLVA